MRFIKPIIDRPSYHAPIQKAIYAYLYAQIFAPIYEILFERPQMINASNIMLLSYLRLGKLTYEGNTFKGKLNATVSRQLRAIGAKYNKTSKGYTIPLENLPTEIKVAIVEGNQKVRNKAEKITQFLKAVEGRDLPSLGIELQYGKVMFDLDKQFDSTTKKILPEHIQVGMPKYMQEKMAEAYTKNLDKYIKDWHDQQILRLRSVVTENTLIGLRAENLIEAIQYENKVSYNKAKFLAKQETSLLTAQYRQERYTENGLNWYMWSTSNDQRVRHDHKELNGKYFRFDNPPVTDIHTMARNNPGQDYGCRCVAIPVLSEAKERQLEEANR